MAFGRAAWTPLLAWNMDNAEAGLRFQLVERHPWAFHADGIQIVQFNEPASGQTVFHLHFHVIPIYEGVELRRHASKPEDGGHLAHNAEMIREALKFIP